MFTYVSFIKNSNIILKLRSLLAKRESKQNVSINNELIDSEINKLQTYIQKSKENSESISDDVYREKISNSFERISELFSNENVNAFITWTRYVNISVNCINKPITILIEYITDENYITLSRRITELSKKIHVKCDPTVINNIDCFSDAMYRHILNNINPEDVPSLIALGRSAQTHGNYDEAAKWHSKILTTNTPFNGITALLSCYDTEVKELILNRSSEKNAYCYKQKRVKELNRKSCNIYEEWCHIYEERNIKGALSEKEKKEYVSLVTGYSRFERSRGDYKKALTILNRIPSNYPDIHRVYTEEAMLYQFKPSKNSLYNLDKAIEMFEKAYDELNNSQEKDQSSIKKSQKIILMPLANMYFQSGRNDDAKSICNTILQIDENEHRAKDLINRIDQRVI